jgi:hypothetical protein
MTTRTSQLAAIAGTMLSITVNKANRKILVSLKDNIIAKIPIIILTKRAVSNSLLILTFKDFKKSWTNITALEFK